MHKHEYTTPLLTQDEQETAIKYWDYGWSFQEITARLLDLRNEEIKGDMLREVGILVSKHYNRKAYPIEYYKQENEE
jgi:hypothetical protein